MGVLTDDMRRVVAEQQLGFVATVTPDGKPNAGAGEIGARVGGQFAVLHQLPDGVGGQNGNVERGSALDSFE